MKKIFIFLLVLFPMLCVAQQIQHAQFLGIPINGTCDAFGKALEAKGYKFYNKAVIPDYADSHKYMYKGKFYSTDATIVLESGAGTENIVSVLVSFKEDLFSENLFNDIKADLSKNNKYRYYGSDKGIIKWKIHVNQSSLSDRIGMIELSRNNDYVYLRYIDDANTKYKNMSGAGDL